jgi:hypothetical protein
VDRHGGVPLGELTPEPEADADGWGAVRSFATIGAIVGIVLLVLWWFGTAIANAASCGGG